MKAPNHYNVGGNVGYLIVANNSPFKNFTSSSNQISAKNKDGGNVGMLKIEFSTNAFQIDFVSCDNTLSNVPKKGLLEGGIKKIDFIKKKKFLTNFKKKIKMKEILDLLKVLFLNKLSLKPNFFYIFASKLNSFG